MFCHQPKTADYRITIKLFDKKAEKSNSKLKYLMHSMLLGKTLRGRYVVSLKREGMNLNDSKIHDPVSEMSLIGGEVLDDLELEVTAAGDVTKIRNLKDIKAHWKDDVRFRLEHTYAGQVAENIISHMDKRINDETLFINSLQRDPFLYFYLKAMNGTEKDMPVYWIAGIPVIFERKLKKDNNNGEETVRLILDKKEEEFGKLQDYYSKIYGRGSMRMDTDISYSLQNGFIKNSNVFFEIYWDEVPVKSFNMEVELL